MMTVRGQGGGRTFISRKSSHFYVKDHTRSQYDLGARVGERGGLKRIDGIY